MNIKTQPIERRLDVLIKKLLKKEVNAKVLWNIIIEGRMFNGIKYR